LFLVELLMFSRTLWECKAEGTGFIFSIYIVVIDSFTFKTRKTIFYPFSCISWSIQIIKAHDNFWRFLLEFMFVFILIVCIQQRHDNMAWNRSSFTLNYTIYLLFTHSYFIVITTAVHMTTYQSLRPNSNLAVWTWAEFDNCLCNFTHIFNEKVFWLITVMSY